uniref:Uncharacterized protein n=1 Tax=Nelumbo nucifera TaxID=4432 RepID=A0A822XJC7_NELNU|nr:TPA_asm: hypothetical protein HUJ06_020338 [Nelumbo nucifera]
MGFESPSPRELLSLSSFLILSFPAIMKGERTRPSCFSLYATVWRASMALFTLLSEGEPVSSSKILATFLFCPSRFW